ncbi:MAG: hypothetical protein E6Q97_26135 [Desulfurellales bacterium]|nr:MAG: hypothetical protein E6Q97_26135 [Desulfurellales bacterium]
MSFSTPPYAPSRPTFFVSALAVAPGNGKSMLSIENAAGSGRILRLVAVQTYNVQTTAVVGVNARFDLVRFATHAAGTLLTAATNDTTNSLSTGITARTDATLTGEV